MKVFNVQQIRAVDQYTIQNEPITSLNLMERAASACSNWITKKYTKSHKFLIFCGTGNNGGDGLVIARQLFWQGYAVHLYIVTYSKKTSADFTSNQKKITTFKIPCQEIHTQKEVAELKLKTVKNTIIVDALLGSGLNKTINGMLADLIKKINALKNPIIAIDIPSGLFCDGKYSSQTIKAHYSLSFQFPKLAFFFAQNHQFCGDWQILPIGLNENFIQKQKTNYYYFTTTDAALLVKKRKKFSHKGNYGHCQIVAGMLGKIGAAMLCAKACLKTGAGLVTLHLPRCGYQIAQTYLPEAMVNLNEGEDFLKGEWQEEQPLIAVGCGIGTHPKTQVFIDSLLQKTSQPLVIDADAINILAKNKSWLDNLPENSILTPHPKEFQRLVGNATDELQRLKKQKEFAKKYQIYVVLKGAHSAIATPNGEVFFNSSGNPALAKGGSGDVLTGIIISLLAQKYSPLHSCLLGVFLHGLCADICLQKQAVQTVLASDLIKSLETAWNF